MEEITLKSNLPALDANPSRDISGNRIQYPGRAKYNVDLKSGPCLTFDGSADYLSGDWITGSESVSCEGTATPSVSAGRIDFTAGTCWKLQVDDKLFPCIGPSEPGQTSNLPNVIYSTDGDELVIHTADIATFWAGTQDEYFYEAQKGYWDGGLGWHYPYLRKLLKAEFSFDASSPSSVDIRITYSNSNLKYWVDDTQYNSGDTATIVKDTATHTIYVEDEAITEINFMLTSNSHIVTTTEQFTDWHLIGSAYFNTVNISGDIAYLKDWRPTTTVFFSNTLVSGDIANISEWSPHNNVFMANNNLTGDIASLENWRPTGTVYWYDTDIYGDIYALHNWNFTGRAYFYNTNISDCSGNSTLFPNSDDISIHNCQLTQQAVDNVLRAKVNDCAAGGPTGGTLSLEGNTAPSAAGYADKNTLQTTYGWTVTTD